VQITVDGEPMRVCGFGFDAQELGYAALVAPHEAPEPTFTVPLGSIYLLSIGVLPPDAQRFTPFPLH
jgi:hypothetical protein